MNRTNTMFADHFSGELYTRPLIAAIDAPTTFILENGFRASEQIMNQYSAYSAGRTLVMNNTSDREQGSSWKVLAGAVLMVSSPIFDALQIGVSVGVMGGTMVAGCVGTIATFVAMIPAAIESHARDLPIIPFESGDRRSLRYSQ